MAIAQSTTAPIYVKDVRRNKATRDFDAYVTVDGVETYISSHDRSWDAESACDAYVLADLQRRPAADMAVTYELVVSSDESIRSHAYTAGACDIWIDADEPSDRAALGVSEMDYEASKSDARNLFALLSHPDIQAWMSAA